MEYKTWVLINFENNKESLSLLKQCLKHKLSQYFEERVLFGLLSKRKFIIKPRSVSYSLVSKIKRADTGPSIQLAYITPTPSPLLQVLKPECIWTSSNENGHIDPTSCITVLVYKFSLTINPCQEVTSKVQTLHRQQGGSTITKVMRRKPVQCAMKCNTVKGKKCQGLHNNKVWRFLFIHFNYHYYFFF